MCTLSVSQGNSQSADCKLHHVQVVHDSDQNKEGDELLSAFNVATFKADEDDAAFWNRLIPVSERPKTEPEAAFQSLGARSTRYRAQDDVSLYPDCAHPNITNNTTACMDFLYFQSSQ